MVHMGYVWPIRLLMVFGNMVFRLVYCNGPICKLRLFRGVRLSVVVLGAMRLERTHP